MGRHEIRNKVLFLSESLIHPSELFRESFIYAVFRFSHQGENRSGYVFGRHFELTAYMILAEFAEKLLFLISQQIVETDSGSYEYFLYSGDVPQLF